MKNQKLVIISVVLAILFLAILGTVVILKDDVSAATSTCNHTWGPWECTGVGVHVHYCTKGCGTSEGQDCNDYSRWVAQDGDVHWWKCFHILFTLPLLLYANG